MRTLGVNPAFIMTVTCCTWDLMVVGYLWSNLRLPWVGAGGPACGRYVGLLYSSCRFISTRWQQGVLKMYAPKINKTLKAILHYALGLRFGKGCCICKPQMF